MLLLASLQKVSNTAAGLAIFKQRSWMLGVWNSCPTHTSPTASQTRSVQPPDCSSPYPVTISRCLEKTELVWFDGKRNWFLNFPSLLQLSPPRRNPIIQPQTGENKCLQNHLEVLSVWSEPLQKSLQQPNELQTHRTLDSARGMMDMPGLVHALTSGMTGKCHRTKGFRFYHYSHYVSCNFFPPYYCSS